MRVLLFGANGQLGMRLATMLGEECTAIDRTRCDFLAAGEKEIEMLIAAVDPQLVINAAAYTAVDLAESHPEEAQRINGFMPGLIARITQRHKIPFLHFSTDYVFDGLRGAPYREDAQTHPMNIYGGSKLTGEQEAAAQGGYVFRIQLVYAPGRKNFFTMMVKQLREQPEIRVVADQLGAPSFAGDVAQAVMVALPYIADGRLPASIYHLTAAGGTSRHGFACAIADAIGSTARIVPVMSAEYPTPAPRPKDTRLDCRALAAHGIAMPHWRDGLRHALEELHANS